MEAEAVGFPSIVRHFGRTRAKPGGRVPGTDEKSTGTAVLADVAEHILSAAIRRDHAAFAEIVTHYEPRLRTLIYHLVLDTELTHDVLQETYLRAYRALPSFRREAALGTWLHRIACTAALEQVRRLGRRRDAPAPEATGGPAHAPDPGGDLALREAVAAALATLPPEQRLTLLLIDREGYDYRAVAEIMRVSPGTVCSRLQRARTKLRRTLGEIRPSATTAARREES